MYDPTITTEHPELVSVERGSQVQCMWAFLTYEPMIRIYAFDVENKTKIHERVENSRKDLYIKYLIQV